MRRVVWLAILLIAVLGVVAQAEMIATSVMSDSANYTSTGADTYARGQSPTTNFRTQTKMEIHNRSGSTRISIPFMRFDLDACGIGKNNKLNEAIFKYTISYAYRARTVTFDIWGLIDTGDSTDVSGEMWDVSAITQTYATATLGWYTIVASGGEYTSYSMNTSKWQKLGSVTYTTLAGTQVTPVVSNTTQLNLDAFFAANTNHLVTLAITPYYDTNASYQDMVSYENGSNYPTITFPHAYPVGASNPSPADDVTIIDPSALTLSWNTYDIGEYDLWFGPADANESNYESMLTKIATIEVDQADEEASYVIPAEYLPLSSPQDYTWVLEGYLLDPNGVRYTTEPNTVSAWQFECRTIPQVAANPADQYVYVGETATFTAQFNCFMAIDSIKWYKEAGETDIEVDNPDDADITIVNSSEGTSYTSTLTIINVDGDDDGQYYCLAENTSGNAATANALLVAKRMLAHYKLDGTAEDAADDNDGTLMGEPNFAAGIDGQAMQFDSDDITGEDYVDLPDGFATFNSGLSFSVWARPTDISYFGRFIDMGNGQASDNILFFRATDSGRLVYEVWSGATSVCYVRSNDGVIEQDEWQNFVVTMSETGSVVIYKNGVSVATGSGTLPANITRTSNYIGKSNWATDDMYTGYMDDIRIYNYSLTADEAGVLYSDQEGNFCRTAQTYDYSGDCKVDMDDFAILAKEWLTDGNWPL